MILGVAIIKITLIVCCFLSGIPSEHKPSHGEIRQIHIEKSSEQLGITIEEGGNSRGAGGTRGVFVSSVTQKSLAYQAGLKVGDQLLEVCGMNLRCANYDLAAKVSIVIIIIIFIFFLLLVLSVLVLLLLLLKNAHFNCGNVLFV